MRPCVKKKFNKTFALVQGCDWWCDSCGYAGHLQAAVLPDRLLPAQRQRQQAQGGGQRYQQQEEAHRRAVLQGNGGGLSIKS